MQGGISKAISPLTRIRTNPDREPIISPPGKPLELGEAQPKGWNAS